MHLCQCKNLHSSVFDIQSEIKPALSGPTKRGRGGLHTDCDSITDNYFYLQVLSHYFTVRLYTAFKHWQNKSNFYQQMCQKKWKQSLPPAEWRECQPGSKSVQPSWYATYCTTGLTIIESSQPEIWYKLDGTPLLKQQVMQILHWHICHSGHFSLTVPYLVLAGHKFWGCEQK
jgi:hypothetical protein